MPCSRRRISNCRIQRSLVLLWVYLLRRRRIHFNNLASYKTSSKRRRQHQLDLCSQSVPLSSHTWGYMYSIKTSEVFLCFLGLRIFNTFSELSPIFLLPIGVQTPGHPSTVILPRMTQSKQLLSFFRRRLSYSTSTGRHSKVVQRCRRVDRYSTYWKSSKSGFGSMPVRSLAASYQMLFIIVGSPDEVLMSQMRR
jgi:hypothetical protein